MKALSRNLLTGLSILLPVVISLQLLFWLVRSIEGWLRAPLALLLPDSWYFPGLATAVFLAIALVIGLTTRMEFIRQLWSLPGKLLERIPLVSYLYTTIQDFLDIMRGKGFEGNSVVWVELPDKDSRVMGIVTRTGGGNGSKLAGMLGEDEVAVYLPMSYQAGGYMVVLPKSRVEKIDVNPGDALRVIFSAGLGKSG